MTKGPVLARLAPAAAGLSSRSVLDLLDDVEDSGLELHSLMVLRSGSVVTEGWWTPYRPELPHLLYSLSKSFVSAAIGLLIADGVASLDERLVDVLARWVPEDAPDEVGRMTVRHALTMSTGHTIDPIFPMLGWAAEHHGQDWLEGFLGLRPGAEPGSLFTYDQLATYVLSRIVTERTGRRVVDFLEDRLLGPLGIEGAMWLTDRLGNDWGFSGLHVRTEDVARFGEMIRCGGRWNDRQVLPADWVAEATRLQVRNDTARRAPGDPEANPDWLSGYGYQFWMCRHGFRGDGAHGQFCVVWPDEEMVIATTAAVEDMQGLLDRFEAHLVPGLARATPEDDDRLAARMSALVLPTVVDDGSDVPVRFSATNVGSGAARRLKGIEVERSPEGTRVLLDVAVGGGAMARGGITAGHGRWVDGTWPSDPPMPVAACAGRVDGRLRLDLTFVQTPHHLVIDADPTSGSFDARWSSFPLHGTDPGDFAVA